MVIYNDLQKVYDAVTLYRDNLKDLLDTTEDLDAMIKRICVNNGVADYHVIEKLLPKSSITEDTVQIAINMYKSNMQN